MPATPRQTRRNSGLAQGLVRRSPFTSYIETLRSSGLRVVHDDLRTNGFNFVGKEQAWSVNRDSRWLGGTDTLWEGAGEGTLGSWDMVASGKEMKIIGRAPSSAGATFSYRVDGGEKIEVPFASASSSPSTTDDTLPDLGPFNYREWASITLPSDTESHRLSFIGLPIGTSVDYAVVTIHDSAPLSEEDVIVVDDTDGSLEWKGIWSELKGGDLGDEVAAFGGGVHAASEVGSEVKIRFVGSSISLYTLLPPSSLSASFTLDKEAPQTRSYGSLSPGSNEGQAVVPNYLLYSSTGLSSSLHTLTVKLLENQSNSSFTLDYITYSPCFASLDTLAASGGDPAKFGSAASSDQINNGTQTKKGMSPGTMAGTIVGVVVVVLTLVTCFCCQGKRYFLRRAWRNWRDRSRGSGKESKRGLNASSSTDEKRSPSPDWAFRNPNASRDDSRTSLEIDLDLDLSPRAREKRHQNRDRTRTRNKIRASESGTKDEDPGKGRRRSRSRTKARGDNGRSGSAGPSSSRTPPTNDSSTAGPIPIAFGESGNGSGHEEPWDSIVLDLGPITAPASSLSDRARGKLPARVDYGDTSGVGSGAGNTLAATTLTPMTGSRSRNASPPPSHRRSAASIAESEEASQVEEEQANVVTPFVYQPIHVTPFTSMEPSTPRAPHSKQGKEKGNRHEGEIPRAISEDTVTPFTAMEPSSSSKTKAKAKGMHRFQDLPEGSVTPFTMARPSDGAGLSKTEMDPTLSKALHTSYSASIPPTPRQPSHVEPSHMALQAQLSALMDEVDLQHSRGQTPDPERLNGLLGLGRMIEEDVEELEGKRHGREALPPAYDALDDERIGIAL